MAKTPSKLIEITSRHQVYIEGHKTHISNKFGTFLQEMARSLDKRLLNKDLTKFSRDRLETLLKNVNNDLKDIYKEHYKVWREQIIDFADYEAGFEVKSLSQVVDNYDFKLPSRTQLRSAVFSSPLSGIKGPDKGKLLSSFYNGWTSKTIELVEGTIRAGYYQGLTTPQIVRQIKGTSAQNFRDGQLARGNKDIEMLTRTAIQHAAGEAREETWKNNSDIVKGIKIVVTLDDRTTAQCQSMDGLEFSVGEGPRPPFHIGCRSTVVANLDERFSMLESGATRRARDPDNPRKVDFVPAKENYFEWLKQQTPEYQDSVIGPNRGKLLRDGGISAKRFGELSLNKTTYKPLTLSEMKKNDVWAIAFEKANLN